MKRPTRKVLTNIDSNTNLDFNPSESKEDRRKSRKSLLLCSDDDEEEFDDSDDYNHSDSDSDSSSGNSSGSGSGSDDEEEEDYDTAIGIKSRSKNSNKLCIDDEEDDDDYLSPLEVDDDGNHNNKKSRSSNEKRKDHPDSIIKTKKKSVHQQQGTAGGGGRGGGTKKTPNPKPRKRRRSSARFLRLSGRFEEDDEDLGMDGGITFVGGESQEEQQEKLGEMYRQAIRLNAENKINVGNSWGLNLIDNIDKFLGDENEDGISMDQSRKSGTSTQHQNSNDQKQQQEKQDGESNKRVNFTRASCTLDASVKIYSYRVDDVHLTSYKVLANLNRTDGGKEKKQDLFDDGGDVAYGDEEQELSKRRSLVDESRRNVKRSAVDTLESNLSNINVSKLDAAYDIDPIFHKMSQKFDEGGAKGLLLVNLGVASDGCRIVLDSKEDTTEVDEIILQKSNENDNAEIDDDDDEKMNESSDASVTNSNSDVESLHEEGEIDISEISNKLQELLLCSPLETIQLVPQLEELRTTYASLEEEGFTDKSKVQKLKSKRYANDEEVEKAAEKKIHREAFERSRASGIQSMSILAPNMSMFTTATNTTPSDGGDDDNDEDQYAPDDYGGGFDDFDDDDHGDIQFDNFIAANDSDKKYSSTSFVENEMSQDEFPSYSSEKASNTTFLDAVCTGDALNNGGEYNYFDANTLDTMVAGNQWAGSAHWKKSERLRTKPKRFTPSNEEEPKKRDQKRKKRKDTKDTKTKALIDLKSCHKCLDDLLKQKKKTRGKKTTTDQSQFTKAMVQKHSKERNILPQDAEIGIRQFSSLFMRPNAMISELNVAPTVPRKSVGFLGADIMQFDDGIDDSYDDGPGFELNDNDGGNFVEMDDYVVKDLEDVRKVEKVQVKHATVAKKVDVKRLKKDLWSEVEARTAAPQLINDSEETEQTQNDSEMSMEKNSENCETSFKNVVDDLGANQAQEDVSLAFYFICVLHLANEKCLKLENGEHGLNDFVITRDEE